MLDLLFANPRLCVIGIDGGPGSGKTTGLARFKQHFEDCGFRVGIRSEVATEFIKSGFPPWSDWTDPNAFQRFLLRATIERDKMACEMLLAQKTIAPLLLLCDRPTFGGMAYTGRPTFLTIVKECGATLPELISFYTAGVHLVTAADGALEFYNRPDNDNQRNRLETPEQAVALDRETEACWRGHPHHFRVDNSTGFDAKILRAINFIARILNVPEGYENERKFLVLNWGIGLLPADSVAIEIEQTYLTEIRPGYERRVRRRTLEGVDSYYFTEKVATNELGKRKEFERMIRRDEYDRLLEERDPTLLRILKTRHCARYGNHLLEIDEFHSPTRLVMMEIEVEDIKSPVDFPKEFDLFEVTNDSRYHNRRIAEGSLHN